MTIRAAIEAELPFLRTEAEAMMVDAGTALRPIDGQWTVVAGVEVQATTALFVSPCKIQTSQVQAHDAEVGGRTAVEVRMSLHLPASTPPLAVGDLWEITAVHPLSLSVVGHRLRVTGPVAGTFKTARRYDVEEVTS